MLFSNSHIYIYIKLYIFTSNYITVEQLLCHLITVIYKTKYSHH